MPFYDGNRENVIPVYESSYQFQGYVAQGFKYFWHEKYTHYLFVADDLLLNPLLDQNNLFDFFEIEEKDSYCTTSQPLGKIQFWNYKDRIFNGLNAFELYTGTIYKNEILESELAFKKIYELGYCETEFIINPEQLLLYGHMSKKDIIKFIIDHPCHFIKLLNKIKLPYPIFGGYSDIFILHKNDIAEIVKTFGVFAAMRIFVELAVPTAMKLICANLKENDGKGKLMWTTEDVKQIEAAYNMELEKLIKKWPDDCNFIHPIKLSRWKYT